MKLKRLLILSVPTALVPMCGLVTTSCSCSNGHYEFSANLRDILTEKYHRQTPVISELKVESDDKALKAYADYIKEDHKVFYEDLRMALYYLTNTDNPDTFIPEDKSSGKLSMTLKDVNFADDGTPLISIDIKADKLYFATQEKSFSGEHLFISLNGTSKITNVPLDIEYESFPVKPEDRWQWKYDFDQWSTMEHYWCIENDLVETWHYSTVSYNYTIKSHCDINSDEDTKMSLMLFFENSHVGEFLNDSCLSIDSLRNVTKG